MLEFDERAAGIYLFLFLLLVFSQQAAMGNLSPNKSGSTLAQEFAAGATWNVLLEWMACFESV